MAPLQECGGRESGLAFSPRGRAPELLMISLLCLTSQVCLRPKLSVSTPRMLFLVMLPLVTRTNGTPGFPGKSINVFGGPLVIGFQLVSRANLLRRGVPLPSSLCPKHHPFSYLWRKIWGWWNLDLPLVFSSFSTSDLASVSIVSHARILDEDLFPAIQRISKAWISAQFKAIDANWSC